jgi:hypothetical protein
MEKELLSLTPKRFLCPFCGEWHEWNHYNLGYYSSCNWIADLECTEFLMYTDDAILKIFFSGSYLYYSINQICDYCEPINGKIPISSIVESSESPIVTFDVEFTTLDEVGSFECKHCRCSSDCIFVKLGDEGDSCHRSVTLGFEFEQSDYNRISKAVQLARKEQEKVNMNMEFGSNKDNNIASTLLGIAVKNGESWRIYDKRKKKITDVGDMYLLDLPILVLPTTKLSEGDLIKDAGEYYFVMKVKTGSVQTLCAKTGEMKNVSPIKNELGFSCYSKVMALSDYFINIGDDFDVEKLTIMFAMCGQSGEDCDQNSSMKQLLPLMLLSKKEESDDDMTKMLLMSTMMGGNTTGSNNMMMSYLMFNTFMGKKKEEKQEQPVNPKNSD